MEQGTSRVSTAALFDSLSESTDSEEERHLMVELVDESKVEDECTVESEEELYKGDDDNDDDADDDDADDNDNDADADADADGAEKRKKSRRKRATTTTKEDGDEQMDTVQDDKRAEARRDFEEALAKINAVKSRSKKSLSKDTVDVQYDDQAIDLHDRMLRAAKEDNSAINNSQPALKKIELLPQVLSTLNMPHMHEFLLDNRILEAVRLWMEPLPN